MIEFSNLTIAIALIVLQPSVITSRLVFPFLFLTSYTQRRNDGAKVELVRMERWYTHRHRGRGPPNAI